MLLGIKWWRYLRMVMGIHWKPNSYDKKMTVVVRLLIANTD